VRVKWKGVRPSLEKRRVNIKKLCEVRINFPHRNRKGRKKYAQCV